MYRDSAATPEKGSIQPHTQPTIAGSCRAISVHHLAITWWLYRHCHITARQLRVLFALHEMDARRRPCGEGQYRHYSLAELQKLVGGGQGCSVAEKALKSDLRRLCAIGVVEFDPERITFAASIDQIRVDDVSGFWAFFQALPNRKRPVPVPRRLLRALAGGFSRAVTATILAHLIRCLMWRKDQGYRVDGRAKASWIADVFGVSRRAVIDARHRLVELGWLVELPAQQWELNKWGARYTWQLDAKEETAHQSARPQDPIEGQSACPIKPVSSLREDLKTSKPAKPGSKPSGVCTRQDNTVGEGGAPPNIHRICTTDLRSTERLLLLHDQAVAEGLADPSDAGLLDFVSLAERARAHGHDPARLFYWLISRRRTDMITQADEDAAHARLKTHRHRDDATWPVTTDPTWQPPAPPALSADAKLVQAARIVTTRHRTSVGPFTVIRMQQPDWTRDRFEAAELELEMHDQQRLAGLSDPDACEVDRLPACLT